MESISGYIEKITYRNEENGYTVLMVEGKAGSTCLVGVLPPVSEGEYIEAEGERTIHSVYGEQIKVHHIAFVRPEGIVAIERYLASGAIKGIGEKMAKKIVDRFGEDTIAIMEEEPERLSEIKGISERQAYAIAEQIVLKRETRNAIIYLQQYNVSLNLASKIYQAYGEKLYDVLKENPYRLAEDVHGIGFRTADEIALRMNGALDSEFRVRAAFLYVLFDASQNGHMYLPKDELIVSTESLLNVEISDSDHILTELNVDRKIRVLKAGQEIRVYLYRLYRTEQEIAIRLTELNIEEKHNAIAVFEGIRKIENEKKIKLDDRQRDAILTAATNGVTVITGGPGTGKTTTINVMIEYFIRQGLDLALAAPTGRAAKRMTEATGYESLTIHRLLEASGDPEDRDAMRFQRKEDRPLDADVIIVDEVSMVDAYLMQALLKATVPGMRLILVGDADQLPSVGPGEVLKDVIASECFPVVRFSRIFRQSEESDIIVNAHRINAGEIVEKSFSKDFLFVERSKPGEIVGASITLLKEKLPKYVHCRQEEIQVLCPMRKGTLGIEMLNPLLQAEFNPKDPKKKEAEYGGTVFREGDKVMQVKNDYDLQWEIEGSVPKYIGSGVFNGEIGFIREISTFDRTATVVFDDNKAVVYTFPLLEELELAYAVTIHKSQGSEYPAVIIPLYSGPEMLMTRNLLYTAVTRAKKCVVIVGRYETFCSMIRNDRRLNRYTGLTEALKELNELS